VNDDRSDIIGFRDGSPIRRHPDSTSGALTFHDRQLSLPCAWCGAAPGDRCRSKSGKAVGFHSRRFYAAKAQLRREQQPSQREK